MKKVLAYINTEQYEKLSEEALKKRVSVAKIMKAAFTKYFNESNIYKAWFFYNPELISCSSFLLFSPAIP